MYKNNASKGCGYFRWVDHPFDIQAASVISQLLTENKKLRAMNSTLEEMLKKKNVGARRSKGKYMRYCTYVVLFVIFFLSFHNWL